MVRQALRTNADAVVVVIGCYAQLKPDEIAAIPGVDLVLGANEKFNVAAYLNDLHKRPKAGIHACEIKEVRDFVPGFSAGDRTRSFLKVQDGCDYFCAFCTIPLARGFSRSASIDETLAEAHRAAATGVKEIVLTGVNIGDFGNAADGDLLALIRRLDAEVDVERFRISSIEPNLLTDAIIDFVAASERFVPHFHVPLQSGSDAILKAMRRRYDTALYRQRMERIATVMPHCAIGVDVIVGFPGETEEDFLRTYEFLNSLPITYLHVFTYSERPDTTAIRITEGVVPHEVRKDRNRRLTILSEKKRRAFYQRFIGTQRPVLVEQEEKGGMLSGFTDNYLRVHIPFDAALINTVQPITLPEMNPQGEFILQYELND
jgi:threonylcarbamoyladenosine tRNA methylthiotransferase MtaB